jgi:putative ABC transport system permease protein
MPEWRHRIRTRLAGLNLPAAREAEVIEELSQHLDDRYRDLREEGVPDEAAAQEALGELDDDLVRELTGVESPEVREPLALGSDGGRPLTGLVHDLRLGARLLVKEKGPSLVVIVTLALAIAANTIVFGLTDLLLLRPLPVGNASRLAAIFTVDQRFGTNRGSLSVPQYLDVARQAASLDGVGAMVPRQMSLTGYGEARAVVALLVSANIFHALGLETVAGRTFLPGEDTPGRTHVVVLSHRFWTAHLNGDRTIVGRTVTLNGIAHTVVGILTPSIEVGSLVQVDLWVPLETASTSNRLVERNLSVFGLMRPEQTLASVNAELATIAERLQRDHPLTDAGLRFRAISFRDASVGEDTWILLLLLITIVALVLLVACANVATVMLARATTRRTEIAVRLALGATRARLVRQFLAEALLLALLAGGLGVLLAYGALDGFRQLSPEAYFQLLRINGNVLLFAFALSVAAPLLFAVLPALRSSTPDLAEDLKESAREGRASAASVRSRATLVVVQVAFALTVLIVSGLVVRSVVGLQRVPLGITPENVICMRVRLDPPKYPDDDARLRALDSLMTRVAGVPGVVAATATSRIPIVESEPLRQFTIAGRQPSASGEVPWAVEVVMAGEYRGTFQVPLVEGRLWTEDDRRTSQPVAVVSGEAARRYWPGQSAVGQRIDLLSGTGNARGESVSIVGVVGDIKTSTVSQPAPPRIYRPLVQRPADSVMFAARVQGDPSAVAPAIREALRAEDRDLAVSDVQRFDAMIDTRLRTYNLVVSLFVGFAAIGLALAMTGVYGVTAFSVGQRRHEIGVRLALGATAAEIVRDAVRRSFKPILIGMAIGALGGWSVGITMQRILFEISALDASTYVTVIALLALGGFVASFVPARRVASIDPLSVLRRE